MPKCSNAQCHRQALSGKKFCLDHHKQQEDYAYGLDYDVQNKLKQKYDPSRERTVREWIEGVLGEKFQEPTLQEALKTGVRLCKLMNKLQPGAVGRINNGKMPFVHRENIANFLDAARNYGLKEHDLFVTIDLYEGKNPLVVVDSLTALGLLASKKSPNVRPHIRGALDGAGTGGVDEYVPPVDRKPSKPAQDKPAKPAAAPGPRFCPNCGEKRDGDAKFCGNCGNRF